MGNVDDSELHDDPLNSVGAAVTESAWVLWRRSIDEVHKVTTAVPHLYVAGPGTTLVPAKADLPGDFTLFHRWMGTV